MCVCVYIYVCVCVTHWQCVTNSLSSLIVSEFDCNECLFLGLLWILLHSIWNVSFVAVRNSICDNAVCFDLDAILQCAFIQSVLFCFSHLFICNCMPINYLQPKINWIRQQFREYQFIFDGQSQTHPWLKLASSMMLIRWTSSNFV